MAKKHKAPPGIDYDPITGEDPRISYGTVEAELINGGSRRRLEDVIFRRLYPTEKPDQSLPWTNPTAERWDVLLPPGAPDELRDPQHLCREYHRKGGDSIQHLATIITIRHEEVDAVPSTMRLHEAWELSRGFGLKLCKEMHIAVVATLHVPGRSWGHGVPHTHLCCPVRVVRPGSGFTTFVRQLIDAEQGRAWIDREAKAWREAMGNGE